MGIHRARTEEAFGEAERDLIRRIMPHLARSLQIGSKLAASDLRAGAGLAALERLGSGLLLVGPDLRLVFANPIAERLLRASRWMSLSSGCLRAAHPASANDLTQAIVSALQRGGDTRLAAGGIVSLRDPLAGNLPVLVWPFRIPLEGLGDDKPVAAILFSDPDGRSPAAESIAGAFSLTQAEATLTAALVRGETVASYAKHAGISFHTARAQLRAIFEKTGHVRQADLIAAVLKAQVLRATG